MATIADLVVNLSANSTNLNVGLTKGRRDVKQFANSVKQDLGGAFNGLAPAVQSVTYAVDDFVAGFSTGGFAGGIRGAGNNISQLGMQLGGVWGLIGGVGITLGFTIFDKIMKGSSDSANSLETLEKRFDTLRQSLTSPIEIKPIEPTSQEITSRANELTGPDAARRMQELTPTISTREANDEILRANAQMLGAMTNRLRESLPSSLPAALLTSPNATRDLLTRGSVSADGAPLTEKETQSLLKLLQAQEETVKAIDSVTDNLRQLEQLHTERAAIESRLQEDSRQFLGKPTDQADMFSLLLPSTRNLRPAFTMPGMAQEGTQLGDLNQSIRDKFDEKPSGTPSTGFAPAAEQGSMEAARIILGAMGNNRTMEIQKQQLDAQKAAVKEIQKLGVTMKTTTKPLVVEDLLA